MSTRGKRVVASNANIAVADCRDIENHAYAPRRARALKFIDSIGNAHGGNIMRIVLMENQSSVRVA